MLSAGWEGGNKAMNHKPGNLPVSIIHFTAYGQ
jgi:hypothetical protein